MPGTGPSGLSGLSITGLFRSAWRPKKAVTVLWRRVATISPEAYDELMAWLRVHTAGGETFRWLEAMATNEVSIDAPAAIEELARVLRHEPPEPLRDQAELLRDLIWEASEASSEWLNWPTCRACGRRWAVKTYEGQLLCPRHSNPNALMEHLRAEMERYPGLVDHLPKLAMLSAQVSRRAALATEPAPLAETALLNGDETSRESRVASHESSVISDE